MGNNAVHGSLKRKRKKSTDNKPDVPTKVSNPAAESSMEFYDKRDDVFDDLIPNDEIERETSEIEEYFKGKNILVTGASGFIGTILLSKLLRTMDVNKVYVLFRGKKSKSLDDRLRDYFSDEAFDRLRKERPDFHRMVVVLEADMQAENLGLNEEQKRVMVEDVHVIFHVAATVKFDEPLNVAYEINCKGTETLLNLAEQMTNLESFVYVSTAYSNCHFKNIEEKFYEPVYTHTELKQMIEYCTHTELIVLNEMFIKPMPNTYTLSKHVNEYMCRLRLDKLPLAIVRPSIVMPTVEEPCPLWTRGLNGLTAMYVAVGLGIMRTVYQNTTNTIDMVPGDTVINILLAVAWDRGIRHQETKNSVTSNNQCYIENCFDENNNPISEKNMNYDGNNNTNDTSYDNDSGFCNIINDSNHNITNVSDKKNADTTLMNGKKSRPNKKLRDTKKEKFVDEHNNDIIDTDDSSCSDIQTDDGKYNPIYHLVSCVENPIKLGKTIELSLDFNKHSGEGCEKSLWVIHHNPTNNKWVYFLYFYIYNLLPTVLFFVFLEKMSGKKAQLMKLYRKIFFLNNTIANFSINEWTFTNENALALLGRMNRKDTQRYSFSLKNLQWRDYHSNLHRCLAKYATGSTTSKLIYEKRMKYMYMADTAVISSVKVLLIYIMYLIVCMFLNRIMSAIDRGSTTVV